MYGHKTPGPSILRWEVTSSCRMDTIEEKIMTCVPSSTFRAEHYSQKAEEVTSSPAPRPEKKKRKMVTEEETDKRGKRRATSTPATMQKVCDIIKQVDFTVGGYNSHVT